MYSSTFFVQYMKTRVGANQSITHISSISAHQAQPNRSSSTLGQGQHYIRSSQHYLRSRGQHSERLGPTFQDQGLHYFSSRSSLPKVKVNAISGQGHLYLRSKSTLPKSQNLHYLRSKSTIPMGIVTPV